MSAEWSTVNDLLSGDGGDAIISKVPNGSPRKDQPYVCGTASTLMPRSKADLGQAVIRVPHQDVQHPWASESLLQSATPCQEEGCLT